MPIETVTAQGDTEITALQFNGTKFTPKQIIEMAGTGKLVFNRALTVKALELGLIALADLKKAHPHFSETFLEEWKIDPEVNTYFTPNGRDIPKTVIMDEKQRLRLSAAKKKYYAQQR